MQCLTFIYCLFFFLTAEHDVRYSHKISMKKAKLCDFDCSFNLTGFNANSNSLDQFRGRMVADSSCRVKIWPRERRSKGLGFAVGNA